MTFTQFHIDLSSDDHELLLSIAKRRTISLDDLIREMIHSYLGTFRSEEQQLLWALSCMRHIMTGTGDSQGYPLDKGKVSEDTESLHSVIHDLQKELKRTKQQFGEWRAEFEQQYQGLSKKPVTDELKAPEKRDESEKISSVTTETQSANTISRESNQPVQDKKPSQEEGEKSNPSAGNEPEEDDADSLMPVIEAVDYHALANLDDDKEYSQTEAAVILGVTTKMIRRIAKDGSLSSRKSGRTLFFFGRDIKAYIDANKN
ncbi:MAG: helix-turn-helix domain-containing protein [Methanospirillaceae archaeon]|nr:helix-turn-helix domain-containing protein [Methanospirillaceae archaeon]